MRHFFLIGGCDGARPGRNYYTEFAKFAERLSDPDAGMRQVPLQQAGFWEVAGLPRLLDVGQCNDTVFGGADRGGACRCL